MARNETFIGYFTQMSAAEVSQHYDETTADFRGEGMRKTGKPARHTDKASEKWLGKMHDLLMQMEDLRNES